MRRTFTGTVVAIENQTITLRERSGTVRHFYFWSSQHPNFKLITKVGNCVELRVGRDLGRSKFIWMREIPQNENHT